MVKRGFRDGWSISWCICFDSDRGRYLEGCSVLGEEGQELDRPGAEIVMNGVILEC
jgi:hypothetical protein